MSENMEALQEAQRQLQIMKRCVLVFEATVIENEDGINVQLTEPQISQLVQDFVEARAECKAQMDSVSAS